MCVTSGISSPRAETSDETNILNLPDLKASIERCLCSLEAFPKIAVDLTL